MSTSVIRSGERFIDEKTRLILDQFQRDGYFDFGPILEEDEVEALRTDMQNKWDDPRMHEPAHDQIRGNSLMRMFEYSTAFRDLIIREPFAGLAEAILGDDCHCMSQSESRGGRSGRLASGRPRPLPVTNAYSPS